MNALGIVACWLALQATVLASVGAACYVLARRRGPVAGGLAALTTLVVVLGVSGLALSPWPQWWTAGLAIAPGRAADRDVAEPHGAAPPTAQTHVDRGKAKEEARAADLPDAPPLASARSDAQSRRAPGVSSRRQALSMADGWHAGQWPVIVGMALAGCAAWGIARWCWGFAAVHRYRATSTPVEDSECQAEAANLCRRLLRGRSVELRGSADLTSPATVGWRRPLVLVPADWPSWSAGERRVALAHEIAHVRQGDYVACVLAQLCLAVHLYHPLVHWLVRRLRLEQELAADATAAATVGGRESYALTLTHLALRCNRQKIAWAARPFLPTRDAFLGRIDMLRNPQRPDRPLPSSAGVALVATLTAVGLLVAGLRAPVARSSPVGDQVAAKVQVPEASRNGATASSAALSAPDVGTQSAELAQATQPPNVGERAKPERADDVAVTRVYKGKTFEMWRDEFEREIRPERRTTAILAFAAFAANGRGREAVKAIIDGMREYDVWIMERDTLSGKLEQTAINVFYGIDAQSAVGPLVEGLESPSANCRRFSARVLWIYRARAKAALPTLIKVLAKDEDARVREWAIYAMEHIDPVAPEVITAWRAALKDASEEVVTGAIQALAPGRQREAAQPEGAQDATAAIAADLVPLLKHAHQKCRREAAQGLQRLASQGPTTKQALRDVTPALVALLKDEDGQVRMLAVSVLGAIGPRAIDTALAAMIDGPMKPLDLDTIEALLQRRPGGGEDAAAMRQIVALLRADDNQKISELRGHLKDRLLGSPSK